MSVAATDSNNERASFSQYNDQVEIAAPGVRVWSSLPGNSYDDWSGTKRNGMYDCSM
jgi:serine protease